MVIKEFEDLIFTYEHSHSPEETLKLLNSLCEACNALSYTQFLTYLKTLAFDYSQEHLLCPTCIVELEHSSTNEIIEYQGSSTTMETPVMRCPVCWQIY